MFGVSVPKDCATDPAHGPTTSFVAVNGPVVRVSNRSRSSSMVAASPRSPIDVAGTVVVSLATVAGGTVEGVDADSETAASVVAGAAGLAFVAEGAALTTSAVADPEGVVVAGPEVVVAAVSVDLGRAEPARVAVLRRARLVDFGGAIATFLLALASAITSGALASASGAGAAGSAEAAGMAKVAVGFDAVTDDDRFLGLPVGARAAIVVSWAPAASPSPAEFRPRWFESVEKEPEATACVVLAAGSRSAPADSDAAESEAAESESADSESADSEAVGVGVGAAPVADVVDAAASDGGSARPGAGGAAGGAGRRDVAGPIATASVTPAGVRVRSRTTKGNTAAAAAATPTNPSTRLGVSHFRLETGNLGLTGATGPDQSAGASLSNAAIAARMARWRRSGSTSTPTPRTAPTSLTECRKTRHWAQPSTWPVTIAASNSSSMPSACPESVSGSGCGETSVIGVVCFVRGKRWLG